MGLIAGLGGALAFAVASALVASQARRSDTVSSSAVRIVSAGVFFAVMLFLVGGAGEIARMAAADLLQLIGTGLLNLATGESFYLAAVGLMGLTRAFTTVIGVYNLSTFVLAWIFLNESVTWDTALGAVFILLGVYLVSFYGHAVSPGLARSGRRFRARVVTTARPATPPPPSVTMSPTDGGVVRLPIVGRLPASFGLGIVLAIITGLIWGAGAVWLRSAADGFDATAAGAVRLPVAASLLVLAALIPAESSVRRRALSHRTIGVLAVSGILAFGVSSVLFIVALERVGAGQTVVLFSTAPLFALPLGALFLGERITLWVVAGTVLALIGVALIA